MVYWCKGENNMEDTKGRILTAAAQLFEQQGYRSVSMRAIAAQLGISVGNLTYHFPHKQDIATALAEQELKTIILPEEATLAALDGYLRRMLISLVDHARMFDDPLLFEDLPGQQQENAARITCLQQNLERFFIQLRQQGIFGPELCGRTLQDVLDLIMFSHVGWQQRVSVSRQATDAAVDDMMRMQWLLLRPYLTEKGCAELEALAVK